MLISCMILRCIKIVFITCMEYTTCSLQHVLEGRQHLERYVMLHECSTARVGVGEDVLPPARSVKLIIYEQNSSFRQFFSIDKGRTF